MQNCKEVFISSSINETIDQILITLTDQLQTDSDLLRTDIS